MNKLKVLSILVLLTLSCNNSGENKYIEEKHKNNSIEFDSMFRKEATTQGDIFETKDTFRGSFSDFAISIPGIVVYDEETKKHNDSITILVELGYDFDNVEINLENLNPNIKSIRLFENYQNTLTFNDEGPHYTLYDWKTYVSDWKQVKSKSKFTYMTDTITEEQGSSFPSFNKNELIKFLKSDEDYKRCLEIINDTIRKNWQDSYWIGVAVRRVKFIIEYSNGNRSTKYLIVNYPMGC
ncbi:MAG: hypothetical protein JNL75_05735 [Chitinophagales bacterium]|nr:hypothetical protein [Chitinophagales bacterium]